MKPVWIEAIDPRAFTASGIVWYFVLIIFESPSEARKTSTPSATEIKRGQTPFALLRKITIFLCRPYKVVKQLAKSG